DSYGIEVAKLAGIPESVIRRSKEILTSLESGDSTYIPSTSSTHDDELLIQAEHAVAERLRSVDINAISPLEAHKILQEFAQEVTK
ncbi:MAG: DNA mismatch repair protein MutS, partial [Clostridia bacterium]